MVRRTVLILLAVLMAVFLVKNIGRFLPHTVVQEVTASEFILDTPFADVRRSVRQGKFEKETLRINNAELINKQWVDKSFDIQRPLRKDRYFEFCGRLIAKVRVDNPHAGKLEVELLEDVCFATDRIEVVTRLNRPLPIGVSDLYQSVYLCPEGTDKTKVKLVSQITLKRYIPKFMEKYARGEVKKATEDSIVKMEYAIRSLGK